MISLDEIIVKHSSIQITNYTLGECQKLEDIFSVFDRITFSTYPLGIYYDEETKILYVPRGVDIRYIENLLGKSARLDNNHQSYSTVDNPIMLKYLPRDDTQKTSLRFMIGVGEYKDMIYKSQQALNLSGETFQ